MSVRVLAAWLVVGLAGAALADDKAEGARNELARLEGTWTAVSVESNGNKADDDTARAFRYVFKKDGTWQLQQNGETVAEGTFTLDPSKKPRVINYQIVTSISEESKGKASPGIYELDGDTLTVCRAWPGEEDRPTEFSAGADSKRILSRFKREKP